ncbi:MAG: bifunctional phosphopantothenoylcysteine decarboxylase/phosphopantothenate--cysteine ligase CoaBC [Desulfobacteraceae bacterium]
MIENLKDKTIVLGVCGGIAVYKCVELLRLLQKQGAKIRVIMTRSAMEFVTPLTFQALSGETVFTDLFDEKGTDASIRHIRWAEEADLVVVAPATANIIGKIAHGIADDALSTFMLAVRSKVVVCPAMNTAMYESRAVQRNIDILENDGFYIVEPGVGEMACGTSGAGRFPEPRHIVDRIINAITTKDLAGKRVLVSAGPTREAIDPVRFISNHSSGKMGYAIARIAERRGAHVTLVSGPVDLEPPLNVTLVKVTSAEQMKAAFLEEMKQADIGVKVAAVADYRVKHQSEHKIKKTEDSLAIELEKNPDILKCAGQMKKSGQILVGFAAETRDLTENAVKKLEAKNLDMIVGNIVGGRTGFGSDDNTVTFFYKDGRVEALESMDKENVAHVLFDRILTIK